MTISLRPVEDSDLPHFFRFQADRDANRMAAFTSKDPEDREAFDAHWVRIRGNPATVIRTIVSDGMVVGNISVFHDFGEADIGYWVDRAHWGRGIATEALTQFVRVVDERPLFARAVADNAGSIRVLERCGFVKCGEETSFANARGEDVLEEIYRLD